MTVIAKHRAGHNYLQTKSLHPSNTKPIEFTNLAPGPSSENLTDEVLLRQTLRAEKRARLSNFDEERSELADATTIVNANPFVDPRVF